MSDLPDPAPILARHSTISDQVRALNAAGYSRSQIADIVRRSYQQVRQVLLNDQRRAGKGFAPQLEPAQAAGVAEDRRAFLAPPLRDPGKSQWLIVTADGILQVPEPMRAALGIESGGRLMIELNDDGTASLTSARTAMKQAQAIVRSFVPPGVSLADELIADRRAEVERENRGD